MPNLVDVLSSGLLSARPAASGANTSYYYWATDVNGGTLYQSDGSAWHKLARGANESVSGSAGIVSQTVIAVQTTNVANINSGASYATYTALSSTITTTAGTRLRVTLVGRVTSSGGGHIGFQVLVGSDIVAVGVAPSAAAARDVFIGADYAIAAGAHAVTVAFNDQSLNGGTPVGLYCRALSGTNAETLALVLEEYS